MKRTMLLTALSKLLADHRDAEGRIPIPFELIGLTGWAARSFLRPWSRES
jgi:phytoene/squalene synthetase